jgi:hypothetical protein
MWQFGQELCKWLPINQLGRFPSSTMTMMSAEGTYIYEPRWNLLLTTFIWVKETERYVLDHSSLKPETSGTGV